jgi:hypothetical protein
VNFAEHRPFSDPEAAVRKLIEIANRRRSRPGRPLEWIASILAMLLIVVLAPIWNVLGRWGESRKK